MGGWVGEWMRNIGNRSDLPLCPAAPPTHPPPPPKNSCNGYVDEDVGEWVGGRQEARKDLPSLRRSASFKASLRDKGVRSSPMPLSGTPLPAAVVSTACTALGQPGKASAADARPRPPTHLERRVRRVEGGEEEEEEEEEEEVEARRVRTLVMLRRAGKEKALTRRMLRVTSSSRTSLVMVVPAGRICYVVVWWGGDVRWVLGGEVGGSWDKKGSFVYRPRPLAASATASERPRGRRFRPWLDAGPCDSVCAALTHSALRHLIERSKPKNCSI